MYHDLRTCPEGPPESSRPRGPFPTSTVRPLRRRPKRAAGGQPLSNSTAGTVASCGLCGRGIARALKIVQIEGSPGRRPAGA